MAKEIYREILLKAQQERTLVAVHTDPEDLDMFDVGYVRSVGDADFTLDSVSPEGEPEGILGRRFSQILRISQDSRYLRQIALLVEKLDKSGWAKQPPEPPEATPCSCFLDELKLARRHRQPVALQVGTYTDVQDVIGFVRKITDTYVQILDLTTDGLPDGMSTVKLKDIYSLVWGGKEQRVTALFYRHRKKLYGGAE